MGEENYGFCPACGANLPEGSSFCPECGHNLAGPVPGSAEAGAGVGYATSMGPGMSGKLKTAVIFTMIYAVMNLVSSLMGLCISVDFIDSMDEILLDNGDQGFVELAGFDMTNQEFVDMIRMSCLVSLASAVLAGAGAFLCIKRVKRMVAVGLIAAASLVLFVTLAVTPFNGSTLGSTIFDVIIGFVMVYLVYSSPGDFTDE